ncbi:tRNA uridine-5-carboxymethylaminomethyl(34) synthesis enzyme MnmG [bacterium]|nr:tRNA uridine-5-carboxymethylaminomethyl(34) synthesis enzyme MnmG [bacterium]
MSKLKKNYKFDIAIIGGGHAGCEAAYIASKMGAKVALISLDLKKIAAMPCNPAIGGPGKGHLVREIDALGGIMGKLADKTLIQIRMLNTSKGPAVQSYRAQIEMEDYSIEMLKALKKQKTLTLIDDEVLKITEENKQIQSITLKKKGELNTKVAIVATGTFLNGEIYIGNSKVKNGGRIDAPSSDFLSNSLKEFGLNMGRLKTGTPPRVSKASVDFKKAINQPGDDGELSFTQPEKKVIPYTKQVSCFLTYTNEKTHKVIEKYKKNSPVFSGTITEESPRHCPSIELKVMRFKDKNRHPVFIEPMGKKSDLLYLQGCSTGFPLNIQEKFIHTIKSLEKAKIIIPGYAIVYDFVKPHEILATMETKKINGLFLAGQINGTSGYEEAAAQGLMAGINAVLKVKNKKPFILKRDEAYIGVLIDDLITKIHKEPYRIYTGSAEYRLLLRQSTADLRLFKYAFKLGTISTKRKKEILKKETQIKTGIKILKKEKVRNKSVFSYLKQPEIKLKDLKLKSLKNMSDEIINELELNSKYEDYIIRQQEMIERTSELEQKNISKLDFNSILGLRFQAKQRLKDVCPQTIAQAGRIAGVLPADISAIMIHMKKHGL